MGTFGEKRAPGYSSLLKIDLVLKDKKKEEEEVKKIVFACSVK